MSVIPELGRQRQEDQDFKTIVGKIVSSRPACLHESFVSKTKAKKKQRVRKSQGRWRKNTKSYCLRPCSSSLSTYYIHSVTSFYSLKTEGFSTFLYAVPMLGPC